MFFPRPPHVQLFSFSPLSLKSLCFYPSSTEISMWFLFLQLDICSPPPHQLPLFSPPSCLCGLCHSFKTPISSWFVSLALLCSLPILPPAMVLPSRGLSYPASKMRDVQLFVRSGALYSPKPVQLSCMAPVSAFSRLAGQAQRRTGLQRAAFARKAAGFTREQAVQESALQQLWAFWDLSQYQLLIGSS